MTESIPRPGEHAPRTEVSPNRDTDAPEEHLASLWEAIADVVGDGVAITQGDRHVTWRDYEDRAARLASSLLAAGLRKDSKVGLFLQNCPEYLEAQFAALKIRAIPVNVNYRYQPEELWYLLDNADAEAVVYHASLADRVAEVRPRLPSVTLWLQVDDLDGADLSSDAVDYEAAVVSSKPAPRVERSPDDTYMLYTGGTTGMPKGVMYSIGPFTRRFMAMVAEASGESSPPQSLAWCVEAARSLADAGMAPRFLPACPLMHGTGMWVGAFLPHAVGGRVVLLDTPTFDADALWATVEREQVNTLVIVGDAFALPLVRALQEAPDGQIRDLSSVNLVVSSGAMFSAEVKRDLLRWLPESAKVLDSMGSTEGTGAAAITTRDDETKTARFKLAAGARVISEDGGDVAAGSGEQGLLAVRGDGNVPVGYYKDPEKTERLFRVIDGERYAIPGDWATIEADGTIVLLGRGSGCINTGGEKVFREEVEEVIKRHPLIDDCLVLGVDDDRFGKRVVAVASSHQAAELDADAVVAWSRSILARYKAPREVLLVETVPRLANGKADYSTAMHLFEDSVDSAGS